eukprot:gene37732-50940_t
MFGGELGAAHAMELPFVFDALAATTGPTGLCGEHPPQQLATRVHGLWVEFAKTGELPWPAFDRETRQIYRLEAGAAAHEPVIAPVYFDRLRLDGRVAFVTGGAQGIGYCCAEALAEAGAAVTIGDRDAHGLADAQRRLATSGYDVATVPLDVTDSAVVTRVADDLAARAGRIDILVNNAGIARSETP